MWSKVNNLRLGLAGVIAASMLINKGMDPTDKNFEQEKQYHTGEIAEKLKNVQSGFGVDKLKELVNKAFTKNGNALRFDYMQSNKNHNAVKETATNITKTEVKDMALHN